MLLLAVFTTLLTFKVNIITLDVAACFDRGGDPQDIQLLQKHREVTVPNNSRVVNLLQIYIFIFLWKYNNVHDFIVNMWMSKMELYRCQS